MTLRLVALMSVVLLLSLAASGFLVGLYQQDVMSEVARTASEVGRATLQTFDFFGHSEGGPGAPMGGGQMVVVTGESDPAAPFSVGEADSVMVREFVGGTWIQGTEDGTILEDSTVLDVPADPDEIGTRRTFRHRTMLRHVEEEAGSPALVVTCRSENGSDEECEAEGLPIGTDIGYFVQIERVRVEADATDDLVLKIPRMREGTGVGPSTWTPDPAGTARGDAGPVREAFDEIQLPIPLGDYRELFSEMRRRSLFLFLGVFLVGTLLSAGLATRFTRPIRRLDAGIRRLSEGDLDVEVPVHGKDEIARLGRAFNDMTSKLRANRERSRDMVRREKLSALGRLAAGVAHDVRNPLHSIGLTLQHLRETSRPQGEDPAREFDRSLEIIRGEIRRLDRIVGDFLRFAKSEPSDRQEIDLGALIDETARLVGKEAEWRRIELDVVTDDAVPTVSADGEAIRSALLNLVLNAFEAMPEGGRLELRASLAGDRAVVEVADDGVGIPEEDVERIFEFGYTTREGGNGLGLAIVHQTVVEDHGGRVGVESRPGEGTRVRLELPISMAEAQA